MLAELGFFDVARTIDPRASLTRRPTPYPNWKQGEKLLASADRTSASSAIARYSTRLTPTLRGYVASLGRKLGRGDLLARGALLVGHPRLRCYGLHSQAVAWQGLSAMADVWAHVRAARRWPRVRAGSRSGSGRGCGGRCAPRSGGSPTARSSSPMRLNAAASSRTRR